MMATAKSKNVEGPKAITLTAIKAMQRQLKNYSIEWATLLAGKMFPLNEIDAVNDPSNDHGIKKVYNISSGQITENSMRVSFILKGNELVQELKEKQDLALRVARQAMRKTQLV